ncbi:hypothetical protein BST11_25480 [Mycobacterium alsense]|uniref:ATP-dependent Clp protease proteolytic subunit n=1 Tax=Mycobacterium alsense TaxID=324058 RepID=A0AA41XSA4_9MYCO|nr:ATP-dependent Clp protease proteolytic subunit [Mycobacterium alsense]MCV7381576.1 ATP-dependent Clp protease proteolytic subunit [Mycobacterium alsense]OQZ87917.1 hypothetical protein BST11_25480 [Mycobacterium alsense]
MWNALPKNGMWKGIRSGTNDAETGAPEFIYDDEVISSNHGVNPTDAEDVRLAHRYRTDRAGAWEDFAGDVSGNWQDHFNDKVAAYLADPPVIQQDPVEDATEGEAYSHTFVAAGGVILQAADHRVMGATAQLMIHKGSGGAQGKLDDVFDEAEYMKRSIDRMVDVFMERNTGKLARAYLLDRIHRRDWWVSAEEAVKLGLADAIG